MAYWRTGRIREAQEYARLCCQEFQSSGFMWPVLHDEEYAWAGEDEISRAAYLKARNAILHLWLRNPLLSVTKLEARTWAGVLGIRALRWLALRGYVNHGCVNVPICMFGPENDETLDGQESFGFDQTMSGELNKNNNDNSESNMIIIIGAGIAGLSCARQLHSLFRQFGGYFRAAKIDVPRIVLLEARSRLGGRIHTITFDSHPISENVEEVGSNTKSRVKNPIIELGAQIISGFQRGSPLNTLIRGQLSMPVHCMPDLSAHIFKIWDVGDHNDQSSFVDDDHPANFICKCRYGIDNQSNKTGWVDLSVDERADTLFNDIRERAHQSEFLPHEPNFHELRKMGFRKRSFTSSPCAPALNFRITGPRFITGAVPEAAKLETSNLGEFISAMIDTYSSHVNLTPLDLRLLNWHIANLEYSSATLVSKLHRSVWSRKDDNTSDGAYGVLCEGYNEVIENLASNPYDLNIHRDTVVREVELCGDDRVKVNCRDGRIFTARKVVCTVPLGVLKSKDVKFTPPLPQWKQDAVDNMENGLINKVVLVYNRVFWDKDIAGFGLLHNAPLGKCLYKLSSYERRRGAYYTFWNLAKVVNHPVLICVMAGYAAEATESTSDETISNECTQQLFRIFLQDMPTEELPVLEQAYITRWKSDEFARGSYSLSTPYAEVEGYAKLAKHVDPVYFAGEATCSTHPATVHGAYQSGLRAAGEILENLILKLQLPI